MLSKEPIVGESLRSETPDAYKHYWTRRYMHLSKDRRAFVFRWDEEVAPCWLFDLALKRSLVPPDPEEWLHR
jgi:hypothetical protein